MRSKQALRYLLVAASLAALALPAAAGHHPMRGPRGQGPEGHGPGDFGRGPMAGARLERLAERLELSEAQQAELRQLMEDGRAEMEASGLHQRLMAARQELERQIEADTFDEAAIRAAAGAVAAVEVDLAVERAERAQAMRQILTPEQREELAEARGERRERRRWHRRMRRHAPPESAPELD